MQNSMGVVRARARFMRGYNSHHPGASTNRNRIHRFYWGICFCKITKSLFLFLVIKRNKNKTNCHNLKFVVTDILDCAGAPTIVIWPRVWICMSWYLYNLSSKFVLKLCPLLTNDGSSTWVNNTILWLSLPQPYFKNFMPHFSKIL